MVQGLAASPDGAQQLRTASDELLPALLWLMNDESHVSKAALTSLVNLSQVGRPSTAWLPGRSAAKHAAS